MLDIITPPKVHQSLGGLKQVYITSIDNVGDDLTILNSAETYLIEFRKDSPRLVDSGSEGDGGYIGRLALSFIVPKRRLVVQQLIRNLGNRKVCVYCIDHNEETTFLVPARFSHTYDSGTRFGESNAYTFRFSAVDTFRGIYTSSALAQIQGNEGTVEGDGTVIITEPPGPGTQQGAEMRMSVLPMQTDYQPTAYNNTQYLNSTIIAADGAKYIIDYMGRSMKVQDARMIIQLDGNGGDTYDLTASLPPSFSGADYDFMVKRDGIGLEPADPAKRMHQYQLTDGLLKFGDPLESGDRATIHIF